MQLLLFIEKNLYVAMFCALYRKIDFVKFFQLTICLHLDPLN
jgi:hypothetical protein